MEAKTFAIIIALVIFVIIIDLIRRQKMTFNYSLLWLSGAAAMIFFAVYDGLLSKLAKLAGFTLPSNFIFFLFIVFFVIQSLYLTLYVNQQNSKSEKLAQALGVLENRFKELKDKEGK